MSATNKTNNYQLPLFVGSDVPSWLTDWNGAMNDIDKDLASIATQAQGASGAVDGINQSIQSINQSLVGLNNSIANLSTNLSNTNNNISEKFNFTNLGLTNPGIGTIIGGITYGGTGNTRRFVGNENIAAITISGTVGTNWISQIIPATISGVPSGDKYYPICYSSGNPLGLDPNNSYTLGPAIVPANNGYNRTLIMIAFYYNDYTHFVLRLTSTINFPENTANANFYFSTVWLKTDGIFS